MNPDISQLNKRITDLETKLANFYRSASIERNVETALSERLAIPSVIGTDVANTQNINLTGAPETITVPAQPSGTLTVIFRGTKYNLLVQ